jgi:hypothetical protein
MPAILPTRIQVATRFCADQLSINLLLRSWGDDTRALIRIGCTSGYGRDPLGTWSNGRWLEQSPLLAYWGPKKSNSDSIDALINSRDQDSLLPAHMQELVETYLLSQLDTDTADGLRQKLKEQLRKISLTDFVDGGSDHAWTGALGLASAQNLAAKVSARNELSASDHEILRLLLTEAPLQFGYWGPFKTVLKHLDPALVPQAFGIALARLSEPYTTTTASMEVEDLDWMEAFTDIPSERTEQYMARRMRRRLAKIGSSDPALYTSIAASLLERWDHELAPCSYLPAYVLGGDRPVLNDTGRFVALPMDQSFRRDAHPEAWNSHRDLLRNLLPQIKVSVETFTFVFQVLLAAGETIPELQDSQLLLALSSSDPRIVAKACSVMPLLPDQWTFLNSDHWGVFLAHAEADTLRQLIDAQGDAPLPSAVTAAANQLASSEPYTVINTTEQYRLQVIAEFYIAAVTAQKRSLRFCADSAATVAALLSLGCSLRFAERQDLWTTRLRQLGSHELMDAYALLAIQASAPPDNLSAIETTLLSAKLDEYQLRQLVLQAMEIPASRAIALGWSLLNRYDNAEDLLDDLWQWLSDNEAPEAFTPKSWQEQRVELIGELLARSADITARVNDLLRGDSWQLDSASLTSLMLQSPPCLRAIWHALAAEDEGDSALLRTILDEEEALAFAVGDALQAEDLSATAPWQNQLLLRYVRACGRVSVDVSFAVAAVALGEPHLQRECLEQLRSSNTLEKCWLRIAELGLPIPLATIRLYLNELETDASFTDAVLACVDSIVPVVRDLGLELIASHTERIEHDRLWPALSQSDDPVVQARVAEESLQRTWPDSNGLAAFDRRLLVSRRTNRRAKAQVQSRLNSEQLLAPERREALLDLARGANRRDREWALRRIAELTLGGVPFDGVAVRTVTTTDTTGGLH